MKKLNKINQKTTLSKKVKQVVSNEMKLQNIINFDLRPFNKIIIPFLNPSQPYDQTHFLYVNAMRMRSV